MDGSSDSTVPAMTSAPSRWQLDSDLDEDDEDRSPDPSTLDWLFPLLFLLAAVAALVLLGLCAVAWMGYKRTRRRRRLERRDSRKKAKRIVNDEERGGFVCYFLSCAWCFSANRRSYDGQKDQIELPVSCEYPFETTVVLERRVVFAGFNLPPIEEVSEVTSMC